MSSWKTIANSLPVGVLLVGDDGRVVEINHEGENILGISRNRIMGTIVQRYFDNEAFLQEQIRQCLTTGRTITLDEVSQLRSALSKPISVEISFSYFDDQYLIMLIKDVSKRLNIVKSNALLFDYHYVERILSEVAHEIKNPLSAILGAARLIQESEDTSVVPLAEIVSEEALRLERMLSSIQSFAKPPQLSPQPVNIHRILKKLVQRQQPLLDEKQIEVREYYDPSIPEILADEEKLYQVFLNILKNAVEASSLRSSLSIVTGVSLGDSPGTGYNTWIFVRFQDQGTGVSPDAKDKLFMPFFTTRPQGTGLGLPISMKIVQAHGGKMDVESTVGIGTSVTISLPLRSRIMDRGKSYGKS